MHYTFFNAQNGKYFKEDFCHKNNSSLSSTVCCGNIFPGHPAQGGGMTHQYLLSAQVFANKMTNQIGPNSCNYQLRNR